MRSRSHQTAWAAQALATQPCDERDSSVSESGQEHISRSHSLRHSFSQTLWSHPLSCLFAHCMKAATCALHTWEHIPGCWSLISQDLEKGQTQSIIFHSQLLIEWKHIMKKYILWQHWWHSTAYGISLCHKQWQLVMIIYYKKLRF